MADHRSFVKTTRCLQTLGAVIIGVWMCSAAVLARDLPVLGLADVVREAIARSSAALDAREAVEIAQAGQRVADWNVSPQLSVDALGSFGQSNLANQSYGTTFSQQLTTGTRLRANVGALTSQNQLGTYYASTTSVQLTQP